MAVVYQHIRKDNNQIFYIGIGINKSRAYEKKSRNYLWHNFVEKHGYYIELIHQNVDEDFAIQKEIELIAQYGRLDNNTGTLTNMTDGGYLRNISDATRAKISATLKGRKVSEEKAKFLREQLSIYRNNPDFKKRKREAFLKMINEGGKLSRKGLVSPRKGASLTEESKLKVSVSLKEYYKTNVSKKAMPIDNELYNKIYLDYSNGISQQQLIIKYGICKSRFKRQLKLFIKENNLIEPTKFKKKKNEQSDN